MVEIDGRDSLNPGSAMKWPAGDWWPAKVDACPLRKGAGTFDVGKPAQPCTDFGDLCKNPWPGALVPYTGERKLDYGFVNPRFFTVNRDAATTVSTEYSDHAYLVGSLSVR